MSDQLLFDTHAHLNDPDLIGNVEELLQRAQAVGVTRMVVPGFDKPSSVLAIELAERYESIFAAVGFHPHEAASVTPQDLVQLERWCEHPRVVAVGEIGLDYHYDHAPHDIQVQIFRDQIQIAKKMKKPIIIHDREAHADMIGVLRETGAQEIGGVMHCFSGSVELMQTCLALNFYISLGGPVTFKNAKKPVQVAAEVPLDRLLIETDSPWLAPVPFRGKPNEPAHVLLVLQKIAEVRGMTETALASATTQNALRIFSLDDVR